MYLHQISGTCKPRNKASKVPTYLNLAPSALLNSHKGHPKPQSRSLTGETTIRNHSGSRGRPNATTSAWGEKVSSGGQAVLSLCGAGLFEFFDFDKAQLLRFQKV